MDTDVVILQPYDAVFPGGGGSPTKIEAIPRDGAVAAPENSVIPFPKRRHPFIAAALNNFMENYNGTVWGNNGPRVIKRTVWERQDLVCKGRVRDEVLGKWKKDKNDGDIFPQRSLQEVSENGGDKNELRTSAVNRPGSKRCVTVLDKKVIQPIGWRKWYDYCVSKKSPTGRKAEQMLETSYAAHLNNKLTGGILEQGDSVYIKGSVCDLLMTKYCKVCS